MNQEQVLQVAQSVWEKALGEKPSWLWFSDHVSKMNIIVHYEYPPIPDRSFDYAAYDDSTYDGSGPIGSGATEQEAVESLLEYHI